MATDLYRKTSIVTAEDLEFLTEEGYLNANISKGRSVGRGRKGPRTGGGRIGRSD